VVTGEPDARKSGPSGSEGGRAEKALPSRDLAARPALPRTLLDEWAYLRPCTSNDERTAALTDFLRTYNHHRCHTALGGRPPISRVNHAPGQYI
ncbi:integrase core domain-containing protein, partial [Streptomyces sp. 2MCAF27]